MKTKALLVAFFCLIINSAFAQNKLQPGIWRGAITNKSGHDLPFNFEVSNVAGQPQIAIINAGERLKVTDVKVISDSVFIHMPLFDSEFKLKLVGGNLQGNWIKHSADKQYSLSFNATPNTNWRFFAPGYTSTLNVAGRWTAIFGDGAHRDTTVGEFKQTGNNVTGTFLTTTGDDRYLEGTVKGDSLYLSCFDGGHAFIFIAKINDDNTLTDGKMYAGFSGLDHWAAYRNEKAQLPDAYSLTELKPGYNTIAFTFKDTEGNTVSLSDARFKNKVVIVQMMGSWCPNCMDETAFITGGYYQKYHPKGVEVVGLAYERTTDFAQSKKALQQLKTHFNIPYPILITGYTPSHGDPQKSLPMLADFKGFPTTIIIDKQGNVRKIHTGFSGPGTGDYYTRFVSEFDKLTDDLLAE